MLTTVLQTLRAQWLTAIGPLRPPAGLSAIVEFEARYSLTLPPDVREYFLVVDGMDIGTWDGNEIRFWPLTEIRPACDELPEIARHAYGDYFIFADYSICAHMYAVNLTRRSGGVRTRLQ